MRATGTGRNAKWYSHVGNSLAIAYEVKHTLTTRLSNPTPGYLLKRNENICTHKDLYAKVYSLYL